MASSSCLRLLPRLPVTSILPSFLPSITCFRIQFLPKLWPVRLASLLFTVCRIFLPSGTSQRKTTRMVGKSQRRRKLCSLDKPKAHSVSTGLWKVNLPCLFALQVLCCHKKKSLIGVCVPLAYDRYWTQDHPRDVNANASRPVWGFSFPSNEIRGSDSVKIQSEFSPVIKPCTKLTASVTNNSAFYWHNQSPAVGRHTQPQE